MESPPEHPTVDGDFMIEYIGEGFPQISKQAKKATPEPAMKPDIYTVPLEHYLPLGSFTFLPEECLEEHSPAISRSNNLHTGWEEILDFLPEVFNPSVPWKALVDLWRAHWIRIQRQAAVDIALPRIWRIHVLPDDVARTSIDRASQRLRKSLGQVLETIDISPQLWNGSAVANPAHKFDMWTAGEDTSLYYLFNTLPSPTPKIEAVKDAFAKAGIEEILSPDTTLRGLKTRLYPYQRRSAATMLQREVAPQRQLDPRLEPRTGPSGETYYYGARDRIFLRQPRFYDSVRGGILSETMGLGKTLMVIALVLATKDHWPMTPPVYVNSSPKIRPNVASLFELSASAVAKHALPWRRTFDDMKHKDGLEMENCISIMEKQVLTYDIPSEPLRTSRRLTFSTPPKQVRLCHGTIIVVPRNLMHQWQSELAKHVEEGILKILVVENAKIMLPAQDELARYDVVLFSRPRFENEAKKSNDVDWYVSPLKGLHWLRIVIDEGHNFCSSNTNAALVAEKLVKAERRWIVSGTPAKDLLGVEVDVEAMTYEGDHDGAKALRHESLEQRKAFSAHQETVSGAIKSFGALASRFLQSEPWASSGPLNVDTARWEDYIFRHEAHGARTFTSFSACLRRTLENLVIKTQPEDVERDIDLPPLTHKIIRLEPCFFDKLTANLFVQLFTSNAVTSERVDVDYLFHKNNQTHLHRLIANLRQSGFAWTGFQTDGVLATTDVCQKYLEKSDMVCSNEDQQLLIDCMENARLALKSPAWQALSETQEMGIFMEQWPSESTEPWAFNECTNPMIMGLSEAVQAQKFVNNHLTSGESQNGLAAAGVAVRTAKQEQAELEASCMTRAGKTTEMVKQGIPLSSLQIDIIRLGVSGVTKTSPKKSQNTANGDVSMSPITAMTSANSSNIGGKNSGQKRKRDTKRRLSTGNTSIDLSPVSELGRTNIVGTTSSKFSYIVDRVSDLHASEKILIFYDANHQAYYLSQVFDLLNIKHLIYANTLTGEQRSKYIVLFDTDPNQRVLLMDIKQAAHGLNLSSASRVFFLNPVCSPSVEAQAMKRAHRIGQTRPVHVETLVLRHTVEEAMHERAAKMTRTEHMHAAKFLEDDLTITRIIQQASVLPILPEESTGISQMAPLHTPQQIFGRAGRSGAMVSGLEKELFGDAGDEDAGLLDDGISGGRKKSGKRQRLDSGEESRKNSTSSGKVRSKSRNKGKGRAKEIGEHAASAATLAETTTPEEALSVGTTTEQHKINPSASSTAAPATTISSTPATARAANGYTSLFGGD